ncbi:hypothetical protein GCM10010124_00080 [Pilimelia terevasa]|uniref:Uncharacterized protein n=1 Tax=Pilimelia terevasa TaxID=53372 RepID=A0A8J3FD57_9ACTN|nr:hypothetical protein [Pilimelia terevasa]GGK11433.1 hypothetical protein GCM10010124_00080 [Pilimelia terevasa]
MDVDQYPADFRTGVQVADDLVRIADVLRGLPVRLPQASVSFYLWTDLPEPARIRVVEAIAGGLDTPVVKETDSGTAWCRTTCEWSGARLYVKARLDPGRVCGCGLACAHQGGLREAS